MNAVHELHGLAVELPFAADLPFTDRDPDVVVEIGEPAEVKIERPVGALVAELVLPDGPRYSFVDQGDGYRGRFYWNLDVEISTDLRRVVCHPTEQIAEGILPMLVTGTLAAFISALKSNYLLHASATVIDGRAVGFVGQSGRGKSTIAAMMCANGASALCDDVLRVGVDGDRAVAWPAQSNLRLRAKARGLAATIQGASNETVDERLAVAVADRWTMPVDLGLLVVPFPEPAAAAVSVRPLRPAEAAQHLMTFTRIEGWQRPAEIGQLFKAATEVARRVLLVEMVIPWGPPFDSEGAYRAVREQLGLDEPMVTAGGGVRSPSG